MYTVFYKSLKSKKFQTLPEVRKGAWVHIENATRKDLEQVVTLTGLEYEDVHDSLDIYELPRFERKNGNLLIFIRNPIEDQIHKGLFTETLLIVVSPKYIFTISPQENPLISKLLDSDENFSTTQQYKFLLSILLKVSRAFTKYIRSTRIEVVQRTKDLDKIGKEDIVRLIENEEVLNRYLSALVPMENIFTLMSSGDYLKLYEQDNELFKDVLIEIQQSVDLGKVTLKSIISLRDSYQIIFTNRLNKMIKILTSLTIILTIPTIIASIYGMNVELPLAGHDLAFWIVVGGSALTSIVVFIVFYWKKWV